jgi:hypothetical protein
LKVRRLLDGYRGGPAADVEGVVAAIVALSTLAVELGEALEAVDINPVLARPAGAGGLVALDALVIPRSV